jgi:hypothetical protein
MKKIRHILLIAAIAGLSSCGIFKKDCHCPHFSKIKPAGQTAGTNRYA